MAADSDAAAVDAQLVMAIADIPVGTPIKARLLVHNFGTASIVLPADMLPEGWLISLTIRRSDGLQIYLSAPAKVEMTSASLDKLVSIPLGYVYGPEILIKVALGQGEYVADAVFTTQVLARRKIPGVPVGTWKTPSVRFRIVEK